MVQGLRYLLVCAPLFFSPDLPYAHGGARWHGLGATLDLLCSGSSRQGPVTHVAAFAGRKELLKAADAPQAAYWRMGETCLVCWLVGSVSGICCYLNISTGGKRSFHWKYSV